MSNQTPSRMFTLVQRELQEHKSSLFWTPIITAVVLTTLMLLSALLANRIAVVGDTLMQVLLAEESIGGMSIHINIDDEEGGRVLQQVEIDGEPITSVQPPDGTDAPGWRIEPETEPQSEEAWNFSRDWTFAPKLSAEKPETEEGRVDNLNPLLSLLHLFLLMILVVVTVSYLLGSLYNDRKDRSILFWKSMPVSAWEEVLAKLAVALLVAPAIYICVSILMQVCYILLGMLMAWRMQMDPVATVLDNIGFGELLLGQVGGWLLTVFWVAPAYAYLLLASALAKRSPFMMALAPVLGLVVVEHLFLGSDYVAHAIFNHVPHYVGGGSAVGFYMGGPDFSSVNYMSMALGLVFTAVALFATVYLRRYRFEI